MLFRRLVLAILILSISIPLAAQPIPRPEYPNPQAQRTEWLNLNGQWEFAETDDTTDQGYLGDKPYPDKIIVPFCRESKLSGLARTGFVKNVWYRRTFEMPKTWRSPRTLLHIGACDYETSVWLNGKLLGKHVGSSEPITFEITKQLQLGRNTIVVHAFDDTRSGLQPTGKQAHSEHSEGCMYTRTTGIWQTVWLEGVGSSYIKDFHIEPDAANSRIVIRAEVDGPCQGLRLRASASAGKELVGQAEVPADWRNGMMVINLSEKHLWSPEKPFLYTLKLELLGSAGRLPANQDMVLAPQQADYSRTPSARIRRSGIAGKLPALHPMDYVHSYFGLRSVSIDGNVIKINGKPVFQRLILDQGFYPDGIWTAPTDEALAHDIELSQAVGYNGARLHQKVFEPRYLYWADKMGYLVWGEFCSWGANYADPKINPPFVNEWVEILKRDRNHPSIIGWCPLNETWAAAGELQNTLVAITRGMDPSRPILDTSGYVHSLADPEVLDMHDYDQNPESFKMRYNDNFAPNTILPARYGGNEVRANVPFMVSEFGGIGWVTAGGWGYGNAPKDKEEFYARYKGLVDALLDSPYQFGFCYTQLTDVEQEQNGLYTYQRVPKFDVKRIHDTTARKAAIEKGIKPVIATMPAANWRVVIGAVVDKDQAKEWKYAFQQPAGDWLKPGFDDSSWQKGLAGFGLKGGWEWATKTSWATPDIWLRQEFDYDGKPFDQAMLVIHYDNATEVYVNGKRIWHGTSWNDRYAGFDVMQRLKPVLVPGRNTIAVHTHQDAGGQFIDLALLLGGKN